MRPSPLDRLKPILKRTLPAPLWQWLRAVAGRVAPEHAPLAAPSEVQPLAAAHQNIYETLYEAHGKLLSDEDVVGAAFDFMGRVELGLLLMEGLKPTDTVLDFGCGTGRLAVHLIPRLVGGHYIGVDISQSMLDKAQKRIGRAIAPPPCRVSWIKQTTPIFPLADRSVDMACAFSVFTHTEHEDTYRYLEDALRVTRPGGRFLLSCLALDLDLARQVFLNSAQLDFHGRWSQVRNVTTSTDLIEEIARLAGWMVNGWYSGRESNVRLPDTGELASLGQSTCVLVAPEASTPPKAPGETATCGASLRREELGHVDLTWDETSVTLDLDLTGPLPGGERFHLAPSGRPAGSLTAPPFATLTPGPGPRASRISVSHLIPGSYRLSVLARTDAAAAADALARSGATIRVRHRARPDPLVLRVPAGAGRRWTVLEVVVTGSEVALRPVNRLEGGEEAAPTPGFDADERCPLCAGAVLFDTVMRKHFYQYRRCRACGVLYAIPRPSRAALLHRLSELARSAPLLADAEQDAAIGAVAYRLERIRRRHPAARTVLDIGAGNGAFVAAAGRAGLRALGLELAGGTGRFPDAQIVVGDLETLDLAPRSFDVVTLWDTIEHLVDPLSMVRRALPLLAGDGILLIETPNERGLSARLRGPEWWVFGPVDHLVMFSPRTLSELVRRGGGRTVSSETREVCPWNPPGNAAPLPGWGRAFERARGLRGARALVGAVGLGDWILAVNRAEG